MTYGILQRKDVSVMRDASCQPNCKEEEGTKINIALKMHLIA